MFLDEKGLQYFYTNKVVGRKRNKSEVFNDIASNKVGY